MLRTACVPSPVLVGPVVTSRLADAARARGWVDSDFDSPPEVLASRRLDLRQTSGARWRARAVRALFFVGCLFLVLFFHQSATVNPMSRLLTVFALVDHGNLNGDSWGDKTIDKAVVDGHVFSDKAPLSSFVVAPFYAAWRARHRAEPYEACENAAIHIADFVAAAVPFALLGLLVYGQVARLGDARASRIALFAMFSTCLFNYGNTYYGHMLAGFLLLASYVLAVEKSRFALAGLIGGLGVLTEYPIVLSQACLALWLLGPRLRSWRRAAAFCGGALAPAIALLVYNRWLTGHVMSLSYTHVTDEWKPMQTAFGIRLPSVDAAWELVFGQYRGLLFYAPTLAVLAPLALRRPPSGPERSPYWLLLILCVTNFVFVSSYFKWDGGWCTGPRHLTPVIVLLLYVGAGRLARSWPRHRLAFFATGAAGIAVNLAAAATTPIVAEDQRHPLFDAFIPALLKNELNSHSLPVEWGLHNGRWLLGVWVLLFVLLAALLTLVAHVPVGRRQSELREN